jgi:bacillithiol system protein YtxJ
MSDAPFHSLSNEADWAEARSRSEEQPVLLFKHSAACSVSGRADEEMRQLAEDEDVPTYKLVVQESRALSDEIANTLGVRHETPQAILLHGREPVFNTSHFDVTAEALRKAVRSLPLSAD